MTAQSNFNNLKNEASQYLKIHQNSPINWHIFGPEALNLAQTENKPIFLSIGYSACHWCNLMAKESFHDPEIAKYLNENFINIQVDKEELPDIDQYYQLASQVISGRGGWPLNVFLTEKLEPYFCGTYFPKESINDTPSFKEVIENISKAYKEERDKVQENANQITESIKLPPPIKEKINFEGHFPPAAGILNAIKELQDNKNGGYAGAPKFPQFSFYEFAIEQILEGMIPEEFGTHIFKTLDHMLMGGMYDHARGGVHRYAVSEDWKIPHFEKMLYDQAGFLRMLVKASLMYPSPLILDAQMQTLDYLNNEMLSDDNYFYSAQGADSEGIEGLYFTYTFDEFKDVITQDEELAEKFESIKSWFGINEKGNFRNGLNVISLDFNKKDEFYNPENWNYIRKAKTLLLNDRKNRIPPLTDNKGVSSWNFMLISALVDVIQYSKIETIKAKASTLLQKCLEGIHKTFIFQEEESELSRIYTSTTRKDHVPLFDDYVNFCEAQLRIYELSGNKIFLQNGLDTLKFTFANFFEENKILTRSKDHTDSFEYDNIHVQLYDQSYKSTLSTFIFLIRKWKLVDKELLDIEKTLSTLSENLIQMSLQNPLGYGETMRAFVYPDIAFKRIRVPLNWLKENKLINLFTHFSSRFVMNYHEENNESWEIFNVNECEFKGLNFEEFENIFKPAPLEEV